MAHTLTPKLLKAFIKALLKVKGWGGGVVMVSCNFLVSEPLFLKSGHGR